LLISVLGSNNNKQRQLNQSFEIIHLLSTCF